MTQDEAFKGESIDVGQAERVPTVTSEERTQSESNGESTQPSGGKIFLFCDGTGKGVTTAEMLWLHCSKYEQEMRCKIQDTLCDTTYACARS